MNSNENKYYTLTDTIYKRIKKSIIKDKYKNGRLLLNNLAKEMNVSITPVREALKKLEKDGLIKIIPNKGAVINQLTIKDVNEIYDLRLILESLAIEKLFGKINQNILKNLEKILIECERYLEDNNLDSYGECCNKFHTFLVNSTKHERLIKFYDELSGQLAVLMNRTAYFTGEPEKSSLEHKKIFEAIKQNNKYHAKRIIEAHIKNAKISLLNNKKIIKDKLNNEVLTE